MSRSWLAHRGRREYQFAMGYFDESYLRTCRIFAVTSPEGRLVAFSNLQPSYSRTGRASLDMIRSMEGAPSNTVDFLLYSLEDHLRQEGMRELDLGLAPLSGLERSTSLGERGLHSLYLAANRWYSFRGVRRFKQKHNSHWENVYLAHQGSVALLPKVARALSELMRYKQAKTEV